MPQSLIEKRNFSPALQLVINYAAENARSLRHDHFGSEHLLLGFMNHPVTSKPFNNRGFSLERTKSTIVFFIGEGELEERELTPTPVSKAVISTADSLAGLSGSTNMQAFHVFESSTQHQGIGTGVMEALNMRDIYINQIIEELREAEEKDSRSAEMLMDRLQTPEQIARHIRLLDSLRET